MDKFIKMIKKNEVASFFAFGILILIILILIFRGYMSKRDDEVNYGNRLEGQVAIADKELQAAKKLVSTKSKSAKVRVQGRIIKISFKVNDGVTRDEAKVLAHESLSSFTKEQKDYYDIQFIVEGKENYYPIIGQKHHTDENIVWTKDR